MSMLRHSGAQTLSSGRRQSLDALTDVARTPPTFPVDHNCNYRTYRKKKRNEACERFKHSTPRKKSSTPRRGSESDARPEGGPATPDKNQTRASATTLTHAVAAGRRVLETP